MAASFLQQLLGTMAQDEFFATVYGRHPHYFGGTAERFQALFSWPALNHILSTHRLGPPRLRLSVEGRQLAGSEYLSFASDHQGNPFARTDPAKLSQALSEGATLVLDAVDELYPTVGEAARSLERIFHDAVGVNLYVGWSDKPGFGAHWDSHDVFVAQVQGEKRWTVYGEGPVARDDTVANHAAPAEVRWSGILRAGDGLYVPRGWWHDARMTGGSSIHLTFGVSNPTGLDYLKWLEGRAARLAAVSADLPCFAGKAERTQHAAMLRQAIIDALDEAPMDAFLADRRQGPSARHRPGVFLPFSLAGGDGITDDVALRLTVSPPVDLAPQPDGSFRLLGRGASWTLSAEAASIVALLTDGSARTAGWMRTAPANRMAPALLPALLGEFIAQGILEIVDSGWNLRLGFATG